MKIIDVLFAIAVPVIWGLGFTLAKFVLAEFPPIMLIALRFSVTALALVWFVRMPRKLLPRIFLVSVVSATTGYAGVLPVIMPVVMAGSSRRRRAPRRAAPR